MIRAPSREPTPDTPFKANGEDVFYTSAKRHGHRLRLIKIEELSWYKSWSGVCDSCERKWSVHYHPASEEDKEHRYDPNDSSYWKRVDTEKFRIDAEVMLGRPGAQKLSTTSVQTIYADAPPITIDFKPFFICPRMNALK